MKLKFTDTTLRDAHQSLLATRMKTEDMLPIAETMDRCGFYSVEVWGGATFDSCLRYLGEDPWERLRLLKDKFKRTPLQMLLRGQNLVGYKHYPDDVVEEFVHRAVDNGIDIFRIFDALNDERNMVTAMEAAKKRGAHVQATVCYTISPVHDLDYYLNKVGELVDLGADSICIKDMAGIITPPVAYNLIKRLKEEFSVPLQLHSHCTSGMASMAYLKAVEAGVDVVDTAISSLALGTSQPPCESLVCALAGTQWDPELNLELLSEVAAYFAEVRKKYAQFDVGTKTVDVDVLRYQIPGGMMSNFISQLEEYNALDRLPEVLAEVPRVRKDFGYPPLVTPTSQIVGTQAVLNVLAGERYKMVTSESRAYVKGYYGRPPGEIDEEVSRKVIGGEQKIACRPAELIPPELPKAKMEIGYLAGTAEDILTYVLFPSLAKKFLEDKFASRTRVDVSMAAEWFELGVIGYPV